MGGGCLREVVVHGGWSVFSLRAPDWPSTNFLGMYCYFPVIRLVNFVYSKWPRLQ